MAALTKEALLALKPRVEAVPAPELGDGAVLHVREMNAASVLSYSVLAEELKDQKSEQARNRLMMIALIEMTLSDENGERLLADGEFANASITWPVAQRIWQKAIEVNRLNDVDTQKNSGEAASSPQLAA